MPVGLLLSAVMLVLTAADPSTLEAAAASNERDGAAAEDTSERGRGPAERRGGLATVDALFQDNCAVCHGETMQGAAQGRPLIGVDLLHGESNGELIASIADGFPEGGMPAWSATLSAEDIKSLALWIAENREGLLYSEFNITSKLTIPEGVVPTERYDLAIEVLVDGLDPLPYSIAVRPDGSVLVTEKMRGLRIISPTGEKSALIEGTPAVYDDGRIGGGGLDYGLGWLLDVALHPDYAENGWIYLAYTDRCDGCNEISRESGRPVSMVVVSRGRIRDGRWVDEQTLWQPPLSTYSPFSDIPAGGRIAFDPDGYVFFSVGMKSMDRIQDLSSPHGKIHRLHDDGRIPSDNPFIDDPHALPSIWTYGHRSPQGLEFNTVTRQLWGTEHGPRGGDEVNLLLPGRNYGWPLYSKGQNYDGTTVSWGKEFGIEVELSEIEQPVVDLTPSPAVSAFVFYEGDAFPDWHQNILLGSLKAADLYRLQLEDNVLVGKELLIENLARIRDIELGPGGALYLLLEHASGGQIVRVVRADSQPSDRPAPD